MTYIIKESYKTFKALLAGMITFMIIVILNKLIMASELSFVGKIFEVIYFVPSEEVTAIIPFIFGLIFIITIGWRMLEEREKTQKEKNGVRVVCIILIIASGIMACNRVVFTDKIIKKYSIMNIRGKEYKYSDVKEVRIETESSKTGFITVKYILYFYNTEKVETIIGKNGLGNIENIEKKFESKVKYIITKKDYESIRKKRGNLIELLNKKVEIIE